MISFFSEDIDFKLDEELKIRELIAMLFLRERHDQGDISIIFCSDEYLLQVNREHLNHDYYTDIITFQYTTAPVSGDLFISIDRVKDNAMNLNVPFDKELVRVIVHGLLHMVGFGDKTDIQKSEMRKREDLYLDVLFK